MSPASVDMLLDLRITHENEVDDMPKLMEPRKGESLVSIELPPEDGSVRVRDRSRHESRGRIVLILDWADSASERDVIGRVVLAPRSEDHVEPCFSHPLVDVQGGEAHRVRRIVAEDEQLDEPEGLSALSTLTRLDVPALIEREHPDSLRGAARSG